jgi:electron transfer flavoprotein alpha/beta subunit
MKAKKAEIFKMTPEQLGVKLESPIVVNSIIAPKPRPAGEILGGETDEAISKLVEKLKADQLI